MMMMLMMMMMEQVYSYRNLWWPLRFFFKLRDGAGWRNISKHLRNAIWRQITFCVESDVILIRLPFRPFWFVLLPFSPPPLLPLHYSPPQQWPMTTTTTTTKNSNNNDNSKNNSGFPCKGAFLNKDTPSGKCACILSDVHCTPTMMYTGVYWESQ